MLTQRYSNDAVFISFDDRACEVAHDLGISYLTRGDFFEAWIDRCEPIVAEFDALVQGMKNARHQLNSSELERLRSRLHP